MAEFQTDLNIQGAATADLQVKKDDSLLNPTSGLDINELNELTQDNHIPFYESFADGFADVNIPSLAVRSLSEDSADDTPDPDLDLEVYFKANPDRLKDFQPFMDDLDGRASGSILDGLIEAQNASQIERLSDQIRASNDRAKSAGANPGWSLAGTISGIGADIAASMLLFNPVGTVASTARAARLAQAGRLSMLGAAESGGVTALQATTDPMVLGEDILLAAGLGGGLGAALGLVLPTSFMRASKAKEQLEPQPLTDDVIEEAKGSVGAARTPDLLEDFTEDVDDTSFFLASNKLAKTAPGKAETEAAKIETIKTRHGMQVVNSEVDADLRGKGLGTALYMKAITDAARRGLDFVSDDSVSEGALAVYRALERKGFTVKFNKNIEKEASGFEGKPQTLSTDGLPVVTVSATDDAAKKLLTQGEEVKGSVGAMRTVPDSPTIVPAEGAGTALAGRTKLSRKALGPTVLRNPKRVIVDLGVRGRNALRDSGLTGGSRFYDIMARTLHFSTVNQGEVGGVAARAATVDKFIGDLQVKRVAREAQVKEEYKAMMADVFGQSNLPVGRILNQKVGRMKVTTEEFEALADEYAVLTGNGHAWEIPQEYVTRMDTNQLTRLQKHIQSTAKKDDDYFQEIGKLEVEMGVIKAEELIPGYRPQRWNKEEIAADSAGFDDMLRTAWAKNPDDEWVRQNFKFVDEAGNETSALADGETFAQLVKRDPELADDVLEDWSAGLRNEAVDKLFIAEQRLRAAEALLRKNTAGDIEQRMVTRQNKLRAYMSRLMAQLEKTDDVIKRDAIVHKLQRAEARYHADDVSLNWVRTARNDVDSLNKFINKFGNAKQTKALGKAIRKTQIAVNKESKAQARKLVGEQIEDIRRAILGGKNPYGHVDSEFVNASSRFQRRTINLGSMRASEQARRFLLTNSHDARTAFGASVDPQLSIKKVFGAEHNADTLKAKALEGFDDDLRKALDPKVRAEVLKERDLAEKLYDGVYGQITHADVTGLNKISQNFSDIVTVANTATASMSLGNILLAQVGDLALLAVAGGRMAVGFKAMMRPVKTRKIFEEIFKNDAEMAVLLKGPSVVEGSRFKALAELDANSFDVAGGRFRKIMHTVGQIATIEGWANAMHAWNHWVRGSFGLDFARQIGVDIGRYNDLSPMMKSFYAKHGMDADVARDMKKLMDSDGVDVIGGALRIPDQAAWSSKAPDLLMKYRMMLKSAGDEAMIDPGIADRPFLRSFPGGRLVLQFQSFMFTASERFIAPMMQEARLHPTSIRPYVGALLGLFAGIMSDGLKESVKGKGGEWLDKWGTDEGFRDNMYGGVLRSPMMGSATSTLSELAMTQFGDIINDATDATMGVRPLKEANTRFQSNQGIYSLFGPTIGFAAGTAPAMLKKAGRGDWEDLKTQVARKTPIMNTFYLQSLGRYMDIFPPVK